MAFYPLITGNAQSKFDFPTVNDDFNDNGFDIYVFEESDKVQKAFMIFVLKNESTGSGEDLSITNIFGNSDFNNNGFSLDNIGEDSQTIPHLGLNGSINNKIKANTVSGLLETNTSVSTTETAANASGAVGFIGINSKVTDSDDGYTNNADELNAPSCTHIIPIYEIADITSNSLPANSYCAFIVKYAPTKGISQSDFNPQLTINNSHETKVINFVANAVNTLTIKLQTGTAAEEGNPMADTFTTDGNSITDDDGTVIDLLLHPVGHIYSETNKTIKISDLSSVNTDYGYDLDSTNSYFRSTSNGGFNVDGVPYASTGVDTVINDFENSIYHRGAIHVPQYYADNAIDTIVGIHDNSGVFKNFSLRAPNQGFKHVNLKSTHYDSTTTGYDKYQDYEHTSVSDLRFTIYYSIGKILNNSYPEETADGSNNQYFTYGISCGFYNKLTMSSNQIDLHKNAYNNNIQFADKYYNIGQTPSGTEGPLLNSSTGVLFRNGDVNLGVTLRYNNFNGSTESAYTLPEFSFNNEGDDSIALYSNMQDGGNTFPIAYGSQDDSNFNIYGSGVATNTNGVTYSDFANGINNTYLELKYKLTLNGLTKDYFYAGRNELYDKVGSLPSKYGIIEAIYRPAYSNHDTIWKKGLNANNANFNGAFGVAYRLAFQPKPSALEIVATDEVYESNGTTSLTAPTSKLFDDQGVTDSYYAGTQKISVMNWYEYNDTTVHSSDVKETIYGGNSNDLTLEGKWYGAAGISVNKPICWNSASSSRRYTEGSGNGFYVKHNPVNKYIKTGASNFYEEAIPANFYFSMEDATYDDSISKYRSLGRFYFKNTGDYPIYVNSVSIGESNLVLCEHGGTQNTYMSEGKNKMLFPAENSTIKPDETNSADPTWEVSFHNGTNWNSVHQYSNASSHIKTATQASSTSTGFQHYRNDMVVDENANDNQIRLIPTTWDEDKVTKMTDAETKFNFFNVSFELDPTNVSAYDQGDYYTQVLVSYYVGDRYNESLDTESNGDITTTNLILGDDDNFQSRLHVSKYLVKVSVSAVGTISIADIENDELSGDIRIPNIIAG